MRCHILLCLALALAVLPCPSAADEAPSGFQALFNGKNLDGWKVNHGRESAWGVDHGLLYTTGEGGGWLMTQKEYSNFEIRLEYKVPAGGNSGVAIRSPLKGDPAYTGMEIQILDDPWYKDPKNYKGIRNVQLTGSVYGVVPPSTEAVKPAGEWNSMDITARGPHITVVLNGTKIVDANLEQYKEHAKQHPGILRKSGHLGLQSHTDRVEFRHIYVKELSAGNAE